MDGEEIYFVDVAKRSIVVLNQNGNVVKEISIQSDTPANSYPSIYSGVIVNEQIIFLHNPFLDIPNLIQKYDWNQGMVAEFKATGTQKISYHSDKVYLFSYSQVQILDSNLNLIGQLKLNGDNFDRDSLYAFYRDLLVAIDSTGMIHITDLNNTYTTISLKNLIRDLDIEIHHLALVGDEDKLWLIDKKNTVIYEMHIN